MEVYPPLIKSCVDKADDDKNDLHCINSLTSELTRKMEKKAESSKAALILSKVAGTVATKDEGVAMELLRQAISAANASDVKRTGENSHKAEFDTRAFESLALNHEGRMFQMAKSLDDRLHRYLAFAAIYRGKSKAFLNETTRGGRGGRGGN